jgi:serine/threonine protein kinase/WD40 repeat protein
MTARPLTCDPDRLRLLLDDRLDEPEQERLAAHLESCPGCRRTLDAMAAGTHYWSMARAYLSTELTADGNGRRPGNDTDLDFLAPSDDPSHIGRIGPYEVVEVIGRGGMGVVLKGLDPSLKRFVAIKVLAPELATSATARRRFAREGRAAAAIGHDHIVAIHAVDTSGGLPYLVMQYVSGKSLQDLIDGKGPLPVEEIVRIGMQAARGLAAAHGVGLIHRDIKPSNILLENCVERVKISDFGLARAVDDASLTQSGVVAGTPQYMSPEQARGESVDHRADLFSLGSVLYALCTGHAPFRADSTMAVLRRVCDHTLRPIRELNPEIPDWLEAIVARLHAKDPAARFQTAVEVADLFSRCLVYLRAPNRHPLPYPVARKSNRRRLAFASSLAALALLGLGATEAAGVTQVVSTILRIRTSHGTLILSVNDPDVKVRIDGDEIVINGAGVQEIRLKPGIHTLEALKGDKVSARQLVAINKGGKETVVLGFEPDVGFDQKAADASRDRAEAREAKARESALADFIREDLLTSQPPSAGGRDDITALAGRLDEQITRERRALETSRAAGPHPATADEKAAEERIKAFEETREALRLILARPSASPSDPEVTRLERRHADLNSKLKRLRAVVRDQTDPSLRRLIDELKTIETALSDRLTGPADVRPIDPEVARLRNRQADLINRIERRREISRAPNDPETARLMKELRENLTAQDDRLSTIQRFGISAPVVRPDPGVAARPGSVKADDLGTLFRSLTNPPLTGLPGLSKVETGEIKLDAKVLGVAISPDRKRLLVVAEDAKLHVVDLIQRRVECSLADDFRPGRMVTILRDGISFLEARDSTGAAPTTSGLRIRDLVTGAVKHEIRSLGQAPGVTALAISPDGSTIVAGIPAGLVRFGAYLRSGYPQIISARGGTNALAFNPVGTWFLAAKADGNLERWNIDDGRLVESVKTEMGALHSLAIASQGERLATAGEGGVVILDADERGARLIRSLPTEKARIVSLAFGPGGTSLAGSGFLRDPSVSHTRSVALEQDLARLRKELTEKRLRFERSRDELKTLSKSPATAKVLRKVEAFDAYLKLSDEVTAADVDIARTEARLAGVRKEAQSITLEDGHSLANRISWLFQDDPEFIALQRKLGEAMVRCKAAQKIARDNNDPALVKLRKEVEDASREQSVLWERKYNAIHEKARAAIGQPRDLTAAIREEETKLGEQKAARDLLADKLEAAKPRNMAERQIAEFRETNELLKRQRELASELRRVRVELALSTEQLGRDLKEQLPKDAFFDDPEIIKAQKELEAATIALKNAADPIAARLRRDAAQNLLDSLWIRAKETRARASRESPARTEFDQPNARYRNQLVYQRLNARYRELYQELDELNRRAKENEAEAALAAAEQEFDAFERGVNAIEAEHENLRINRDGRGVIKIWDAATGELRHDLVDHEGPVIFVGFTADNRSLIAVGSNGRITIRGLDTLPAKSEIRPDASPSALRRR